MFSSFTKVALLLLVSLFGTEGQNITTEATGIVTGEPSPSPPGTSDSKDVTEASTHTELTSVGSIVTIGTPTTKVSSTTFNEMTTASVMTEKTSMHVSELTATTSPYVSEKNGSIFYSTSYTTIENNINRTSSNDSILATTQDATLGNTLPRNDSFVTTIAMVTISNDTTQASSTASTISAPTVTETNPTGNTMNIPTSTESTSTDSTTGPNESTTVPADYTQSTEQAVTTSRNDSGALGSDKEAGSNVGVVLGAVIGSLLGCALVGITVYIIFGSKKPSSISHRRLYEDTRNDPVLRLENPSSPYDISYGNSSFYNPTAIEEDAYHSGRHETIAMEDIRPR